jgi:tripeptide aminopeptidase
MYGTDKTRIGRREEWEPPKRTKTPKGKRKAWTRGVPFDAIPFFSYSQSMDLKKHAAWFEKRLLDRFLHYVKVDTTSDRHAPKIPSTPGQRVLAETLAKELAAVGCEQAAVDEHGYVFARVPGNTKAPALVLIAHLDTSSEAPGKNVRPRVHEKYDGRPIRLSADVTLDPTNTPELLDYAGETIISSSGDTLLGADDKAGIAVIVTAVEFLHLHPEVKHGDIEIVFTPDEETGRGTDHFPWEKIKAKAGVTIDGSGDGIVESECFEAYRALVTVSGISFHPGEARGRLVNAVEVAAEFVAQVPKAESPQATDERFGYYAAMEIEGTVEKATIEYIIRDFEESQCRRRIAALRSLALSLKNLHPGAAITVKAVKQYSNMKSWIERARSPIIPALLAAVRLAGIEPKEQSIRGGTDGSRLSERGLPCPNLFDGGFDYHSRAEWLALPAMVRSGMAVVFLAGSTLSAFKGTTKNTKGTKRTLRRGGGRKS